MATSDLTRAGELTVDAIGGVLVLGLSGEVDERCADKLRRCFDRAIRARRPVVADLTAVTELHPEAIAALRAGCSRLAARLHLVCRRGDDAWTTLQSAGIRRQFAIHPSRPTALTAATPRT